jgi:hypothetical protein
MSVREIFDNDNREIYRVRTHAAGPQGELPLTPDMLINRPSGDIFGMTMNAGMGWSPDELNRDGILLLSTLGGLRGPDGKPVALALHQGHYELDIQMKAAADVIKHNNALPYAVYVSDPCDGRTQGTTGMFDSLPYRNDASMVMRRLIRSLPDAKAVIGVATCDKGLPATMMALASQHDKATVLIPAARRCLRCTAKITAKCRPSARVLPMANCRCRALVGRDARPARHPAAAVSSWARRAPRRWWPKA